MTLGDALTGLFEGVEIEFALDGEVALDEIRLIIRFGVEMAQEETGLGMGQGLDGFQVGVLI